LLEDKDWLKSTAPEPAAPEAPEGEEAPQLAERDYRVEVSGRLFEVKVIGEALGTPAAGAAAANGRKPAKRERKSGGGSSSSEALVSPLQGTVFKVVAEQGQEVA